jgi:predicted AAA+ superfamily ATPase
MATVSHYLALLREAYLVAALDKYSASEVRRRAAPPKLVPLNNGLITGGRLGEIPTRADAAAWGRLVENACLAYMINSGQKVNYWREEPLEVDAVVEGSWGKWAVAIKTGPFSVGELQGLLEFTRCHAEHRPLVLCEAAGIDAAQRAGVRAVPWSDFLWGGLV